MRHVRWTLGLVAVGLTAFLISGCASAKKADGNAMKPPFGGKEDVAGAADLWKSMEGYTSWKPYPGKPGWREGRRPHRQFVKDFINPMAARSPVWAQSSFGPHKGWERAEKAAWMAAIILKFQKEIASMGPAEFSTP